MMLLHGALQRRKPLFARQPLDRRHGGALRLRGKHQTRADRRSVDDDRAGAANPMFAAEMRARKAEILAKAISQADAGFDVDFDLSVHWR